MCPQSFFLSAALVSVFALLVYSYWRQASNARCNLSLVQEFLQTPVVNYKLLGINFDLEGYYQERKVVYFYRTSSERTNYNYDIYIEPRTVPHKQGLFLLEYPRPTPDTYLKGSKIFYAKRSFLRGSLFNFGALPIFDREELREILEELVRAARLVEAGEYKH